MTTGWSRALTGLLALLLTLALLELGLRVFWIKQLVLEMAPLRRVDPDEVG